MKKKLISVILIATLAVSITACGDSKRVAELEAQVAELQAQLEENASKFDSETKSIIDSINTETATCFGSCGPDAMYYYKGGILVIKGTGEIVDSTWANKENDDYNLNINRVIIDEGITSIGADVFCNTVYFYMSMNLYKVDFPSTLTTIGKEAFEGWEELKAINIPDSVTKIGNGAFSDCTSLDESTIEKIKAINPDAF